MFRRNGKPENDRNLLLDHAYRPPVDRKARAEASDPRKGNTPYILNLKAQIEKLQAEGKLERDYKPLNHVRKVKREAREQRKREQHQDKEDEPVSVPDSGVADSMKSSDNAPGGGEMSTTTLNKPKKATSSKKTQKKSPVKPRKTEARRKATAKPVKKAKNLPRSERKDVPCCINYPRALLNAIDKAAKAKGVSRSAFANSLAAKATGWKPKK